MSAIAQIKVGVAPLVHLQRRGFLQVVRERDAHCDRFPTSTRTLSIATSTLVSSPSWKEAADRCWGLAMNARTSSTSNSTSSSDGAKNGEDAVAAGEGILRGLYAASCAPSFRFGRLDATAVCNLIWAASVFAEKIQINKSSITPTPGEPMHDADGRLRRFVEFLGTLHVHFVRARFWWTTGPGDKTHRTRFFFAPPQMATLCESYERCGLTEFVWELSQLPDAGPRAAALALHFPRGGARRNFDANRVNAKVRLLTTFVKAAAATTVESERQPLLVLADYFFAEGVVEVEDVGSSPGCLRRRGRRGGTAATDAAGGCRSKGRGSLLKMIEELQHASPRYLSALAHSLAVAGSGVAETGPWALLPLFRFSAMDAQSLSSSLWALAKSREQAPPREDHDLLLLEAALVETRTAGSEVEPQMFSVEQQEDIADAVEALSCGRDEVGTSTTTRRRSCDQGGDHDVFLASPQVASNIAWALARLSGSCSTCCGSGGEHIHMRKNAQEMLLPRDHGSAWTSGESLRRAVAAVCEFARRSRIRAMSSWKPQELAIFVWALGRMARRAPTLSSGGHNNDNSSRGGSGSSVGVGGVKIKLVGDVDLPFLLQRTCRELLTASRASLIAKAGKTGSEVQWTAQAEATLLYGCVAVAAFPSRFLWAFLRTVIMRRMDAHNYRTAEREVERPLPSNLAITAHAYAEWAAEELGVFEPEVDDHEFIG